VDTTQIHGKTQGWGHCDDAKETQQEIIFH